MAVFMGKEKEGVVSSGGYVVDNSKEEIIPPKEAPAPAAEEKKAAPQGEEKAPAAAPEKAPAAAEEKTPASGQNDVLASMAQQISLLSQQLAQGTQGENPGEGTDPVELIDQQIADLQAKAAKGELTYEESMAQVVSLMDQKMQVGLQRGLEQHENQKQFAGYKDRFLEENADFEQFAQSPEAQAIIQQNPVLDHVSAYFLNKADAAAQRAAQLETENAELRKQVGDSIKSAATEQSSVVGGESDAIGVPSTYRGDGLDAEKGGLAALSRARRTA